MTPHNDWEYANRPVISLPKKFALPRHTAL
jgi:hypothetical protein